MQDENSIGSYLIKKISDLGVNHIFGVPGDYVLGFFKQLSQSNLNLVNACDEQGAGFMADAYARMRGLGVVCVTYGVGGFKIINTTAQAFAEQSPVIVISGAPGLKEREKFPLLHHQVRDIETQKRMFEQITVASTVLDNPETASAEIDRVLSAALRYKLPVYIELPKDMVFATITRHKVEHKIKEATNLVALNEALKESIEMINSAKNPVIITGVEIKRFGLEDQLLQFLKKANIPVASTALSKGVLDERHPLYLGIYEGAMGSQEVREYVESSDCLILLGTLLTDIYLEIFVGQIYKGQAIYVTNKRLSIKHHNYENVHMMDFLQGLNQSEIMRKENKITPHPPAPQVFCAIHGKKITVKRLFDCLDSFLIDGMVILADVGDSLFGSVNLTLPKGTGFLSSSFYASLGFSVPGAVGVQMADSNLRPLVLVGDGAFQMTGLELSTVLRYHLNPIVIVLNNQGYMTERVMIDGPFNDIQTWNYSELPKVIGGGKGFIIKTEDELERALQMAKENLVSFSILDIQLDSKDKSESLQRLADWFSKRTQQ